MRAANSSTYQEAILAWPRRRTQAKTFSGLLILLLGLVILATFQRRSETLSAYEAVLAGFLLLVGSVSLIKFLALRKHALPIPLRYLLLFAGVVIANYLVARVGGVPTEDWARRAGVALAFPLLSLAAFLEATSLARVKLIAWTCILCCVGLNAYYLTQMPAAADLSSAVALRYAWKQLSFGVPGLTFSSVLLIWLSLIPLANPRRLRSRTLLGAILFGLGGLGLVLSGSRSFLLTTPLIWLVVLAEIRRRGVAVRLRYWLALGLAALVLLVMQGPWTTDVGERFTHFGYSGSTRLEEARGLLSSMMENPLHFFTGTGFGNPYRATISNPFIVGGPGVTYREYSHSYLLYVTWTTGLFGVLPLVLFAWTLVRDSMRFLRASGEAVVQPEAKTILASIVGLLVNIYVASFAYQPFGVLLWSIQLGALSGIALGILHRGLGGLEPALRAVPVTVRV